MRVPTTLAAAVLDFELLAPPAAFASEVIPKGIDWVNDWDKALATAAERGVPLLISFASDE